MRTSIPNGWIELKVRYPVGTFSAGQTVTNKMQLVGQYVTSNVNYTTAVSNYSFVLQAPICNNYTPGLDPNVSKEVFATDSGTLRLLCLQGGNTTLSNVASTFNFYAAGLKPLSFLLVAPATATDTVYLQYNTNVNSSFINHPTTPFLTNGAGEKIIGLSNIALGAGEYITSIKLIYTKIYPGEGPYSYVYVTGVPGLTNGTHTLTTSSTYNCAGSSYSVNNTSNYTAISDKSLHTQEAPIYKYGGGGTAQIGDSIVYNVHFYVDNAATNAFDIYDAVMIDLLPKNLTFSNVTGSYVYKVKTNTYGTIPAAKLVPTIINNYMGTGRQLVRWDLSGIHFSRVDTSQCNISFSVKVNAGTPAPSVTNNCYMTTKNSNINFGFMRDSLDFDGDGNTTETITKSTDNTTNLIFFIVTLPLFFITNL